ncbi:pentapeptide repeat-containing protein [Selenomonas sp. oral taxon 920]|jgi:uncharacterized protein YjbI with pentapeptide repeats|uniref:pentapeptide repeat-containing protein n=1 Tax=Selenomonas sp. oral taxon 920 TaxID=1884263 RepID=UPI0009F6B0D0|nr:pentapeptide repeat-containing protein [Selenomonas sp. oral taxon 920]
MDRRQVSSDEVRRILSDHDRWMQTNHESGRQADFTNCDLRGFDFCSSNEIHPFHSMIFRGADLSGVSMERLHFKDCDFTDAQLSNANISDVTFESCNFLNAKILQTTMSVCRINQCDLQNTMLGKSKFNQCRFSDNVFREANLNHVWLEKNCHLEGNRFLAVNPVCADFSTSVFTDNKFLNVAFIQCTFDEATFKKCDFTHSGFLDSYIEKCHFRQSDLQNRFMQVQFIPDNGDTIHLACDLGLRTIISRDVIDDKPSMRIDDFMKEISATRVSSEAQRALKDILITMGKTFQEACDKYRKSNDNIR